MSKIKIFSIILVLIIAGGIVWAVNLGGQGVNETGDGFKVVGKTTDTDSDSDGSPDWEELLWGYDPNDPDTGDEGMLDSVKIAEKKSLAMESIGVRLTGTPPEENIGDKFGQDLYSALILLEQSGQLDEQAVQALQESANSALLDYSSKYVSENSYVKENIVSIPDSEESIRTYFTKVGEIHILYPVLDTDFVLLKKLAESGEAYRGEFQSEANLVYEKYKNLTGSLEKLSVPNSLVDIHYELLNSLLILTSVFEDLSSENIDSAKILLDYIRYLPALKSLEGVYEKMSNFEVIF